MSRSALDTTSQYWFTVVDLSVRWHLAPKTIRHLLQPYRGRCHRARRGRHPRLCLWIPAEVVRALDRQRKVHMLTARPDIIRTASE